MKRPVSFAVAVCIQCKLRPIKRLQSRTTHTHAITNFNTFTGTSADNATIVAQRQRAIYELHKSDTRLVYLFPSRDSARCAHDTRQKTAIMIFVRRFASARNVPDMHAASFMRESGSITVIRVRVISHACRLDLRGCARHDAGVGATNMATFSPRCGCN